MTPLDIPLLTLLVAYGQHLDFISSYLRVNVEAGFVGVGNARLGNSIDIHALGAEEAKGTLLQG